MLISVMSPHTEGNGNSTTALFLALGLGSMKKKVFLTHTDSISSDFHTYLGLHTHTDKTSTPTQLVKLLREGAIQSQDIEDYCVNVTDSTFVFGNVMPNFSAEDMETMADFVIDESEFDYVVYDINNMDTNTARNVVDKSDVLVLNVTQSVAELKKLKAYLEKNKRKLVGKKLVLVCNKFSGVAGKTTEIAKVLGLKANVYVIHYNPWIVNASNQGALPVVYGNIKMKRNKVVELNSDISKLAGSVSKIKINKLKEKQEARKAVLAEQAREAEKDRLELEEKKKALLEVKMADKEESSTDNDSK